MSRRSVFLLGAALVAGAAVVTVIVHGRPVPTPGKPHTAPPGLIGLLGEHVLAHGLHPDHAKASCLACHVPLARTPNQGCLAGDCHARADLARPAKKPALADLHRRVEDQPCVACHTEHRGGRLTAGFYDHDREFAIFVRENCADCHLDEAEAHPGIPTDRCAACHTSTVKWTGADVYIHTRHTDVWDWPCVACHRPIAPDSP